MSENFLKILEVDKIVRKILFRRSGRKWTKKFKMSAIGPKNKKNVRMSENGPIKCKNNQNWTEKCEKVRNLTKKRKNVRKWTKIVSK